MMVNRQKRKGTDWERQLVTLLEHKIDGAIAKRIAGSGAIGTTLNEPLLTGDVALILPNYPKKFKIEAKVGYGGASQITIQRAWLNKIREEASANYSIPLLAGKFSGAKQSDGVQFFIATDLDTFCMLANQIVELQREVDKLHDRVQHLVGDT